MKKNLVALMVTVVMVAGALVGCGSKEVQTVGGNGTTTEASAVETTVEENAVDAAASTEESIVEETVVEEVEPQTKEYKVTKDVTVFNTFNDENQAWYLLALYDGKYYELNCEDEDLPNFAFSDADMNNAVELMYSDDAVSLYGTIDGFDSFDSYMNAFNDSDIELSYTEETDANGNVTKVICTTPGATEDITVYVRVMEYEEVQQ